MHDHRCTTNFFRKKNTHGCYPRCMSTFHFSDFDLFSHFLHGSAAPLLDHRQPPERAWERLLSACQYGDCLITVATSAMAQVRTTVHGD